MLETIKSKLLKCDRCIFKGYCTSFYLHHFKYRGKVYLLKKDLFFPPHTSANKSITLGPSDQLLAIGGDLSPDRMILAFKNGIYPTFCSGQPILWWTSDIRCVIFTPNIHISKVVWRLIKQNHFRLTVDCAFRDVVNACAETRQKFTWLTPERIQACNLLHELGFKHSVEVWDDDKLVAGLFGFNLGTYFYISSMFTTVNHASKYAMIALAIRLEEMNYAMMDCGTWPTDFLQSMGAIIIDHDQFLELLTESIESPATIKSWQNIFDDWNFSQAVKEHLTKNNLDPIK